METKFAPFEFDFDTIEDQIIKTLGRNFFYYYSLDLLSSCPKPIGVQTVRIVIWEMDGYFYPKHLDDCYNKKGLFPNPWELISLAIKQAYLKNKGKDVVTQWKDSNNNFFHMVYSYWNRDDGRKIFLLRGGAVPRSNFLCSGSIKT